MTDESFFIGRKALHAVFGDPKVVRQFETMQERVANTSEASQANIEATDTLKDAVFVTLSENAELPNERVLTLGAGLSIDTDTPGEVRITADVAAEGGWPVQFSVTGATDVVLPISGILSTRNGSETLKNKTLDAPFLTNLGNYADDVAAAVGGVEVGGVYRNGSVLQVRVA